MIYRELVIYARHNYIATTFTLKEKRAPRKKNQINQLIATKRDFEFRINNSITVNFSSGF